MFLQRLILALMVFVSFVLTGCSGVSVDGGHEAVLTKQPWIFGSGGVVKTPVSSGQAWIALTTKYDIYDVLPISHPETFTNLITNDNVPVDFNSYIVLQIEAGKSPVLHENFGADVYKNKIQEKFRTAVRDFARGQTLFGLVADSKVTTKGQETIEAYMAAYIAKEQIPMRVEQVIIGKVTPPTEVLEETGRTAGQEQRVKTEQKRKLAEDSRMEAEVSKAKADKAYLSNFGMTADQYLALRKLEIESRQVEIQKEMVQVVKDKQNVSVLVSTGGTQIQPMMTVK